MTSIPGYRVFETLHTGPRSTVLRALRRHDGLPVVCKLIGTETASPEGLAALRREYQLISRISHRGVVEALDCLPHGSGLLVVFRDIGGTSLAQQLAGQPLPIDAFLDLALQLIDAIDAIHNAGLVHKDINPANIVVNAQAQTINIVGFTIASELAREEVADIRIGTPAGTLAYIAPEQTGRINRSVDYRADFYGLGATFYECLTGRPPFGDGDPLELVHSHIARTPVPASGLNPLVPGVLAAIVARLMAKDPEDRYQSILGLRIDIEHCLSQYRSGGTIESFALGQRDVRAVLRVPQKLYGRDEPLKQLMVGFERAADNVPELLLVTGYAGIGKSALVRELYKPITAQQGFFVAGKFEQLKRDIPYAPWIRAFRELVRQAIAGGPERTEALRAQLVTALQPNVHVVTDVIPELAELIGPPAGAAPALGPAEAHSRFVYAFRKFVRVFATPEHPLVVFLDDLQWADLASLKLLEGLVGDDELRHLLVIGAYRDGEVDATHPLTQTIATLTEAEVPIRHIHLGELDHAAVALLVADTLQSEVARVQPLAALLSAKTFGNPLFLGQYLEALERRGLIGFDRASSTWTWDLPAIERQQVPDNVVAFLVQRFAELPPETLGVVQVAACIGSIFSLETLAEVRGEAPAEAASALWPALRSRLVVPLDEGYRFAEAGLQASVSYRFLHDRVQQAAYSLLPPDEALSCHLGIGRALLRTHGSSRDRRLFDIVNQLNIARALIVDPEERRRLVVLNLEAGRRARAAAAYGPVLAYLDAGLAMLPADAWTTDYQTALALHVETAEMAIVNGVDKQVFRLAQAIQDHAATLLDRVSGLEVLVQLHLARQVLSEALRVIRTALQLLGHGIPARPRRPHLMIELARTRWALKGQSEDALVERPASTDPHALAIGRLLARAIAPAYLSDRSLYAILVLRLVRLSAQTGNQPVSCFGYANYGPMFADENKALFGRVALRLLDRMDAEQSRTQVMFVVKLAVEVWHRPVAETLPGLLEAYHVGLETGELEYASYCLNNLIAQYFFISQPLGQLKDTAEAYRQAAARIHQETAAGVIKCYQQAIANLLGETGTPTSFDGPHLQEAEGIADLMSRRNFLGVEAAYALLAYLNLIFDRLDDARRYSDLRRRHAGQTGGFVMGLRSTVISIMIDLGRWEQLDARARRKLLARCARAERTVQAAARDAPANFSALNALLNAERLRATGKAARAGVAYREAIDAARQYGFTHDEAFACERSATLSGATGDRAAMRTRLVQAREAYVRWGALAKVRWLDQRYPDMLGELAVAPRHEVPWLTQETSLGDLQTIDVVTLVRSLQALAGEIRLGDLLRKLMRIVIVNAGATGGSLLLRQQGRWSIEASALADDQDVRVLEGRPIEGGEGPLVALRVVDEVARRQEAVVIADATIDEDFMTDRYVVSVRPRSVLALPLINRGQAIGILYLENNLAAGVFSPDKLRLLELLSAQIAVSIENARLYERLERMNLTLEQQVADRTRELEQKTQALTERTEALRAANAELKRLATTDALTGISNRRGFLDVAAKELERAGRYRRSLSLFVIDIDHFKQINDGYGHSAGDDALRQVAETIKAQIRSTDYLARIGGEEFAVILPETDLDAAIYLAERIRAAVAAAEVVTGQYRFTLTISVGLAVIGPNDVTTDQMLARADQALYRAKGKGRNCVVAA